jgi:hypothetical protein
MGSYAAIVWHKASGSGAWAVQLFCSHHVIAHGCWMLREALCVGCRLGGVGRHVCVADVFVSCHCVCYSCRPRHGSCLQWL